MAHPADPEASPVHSGHGLATEYDSAIRALGALSGAAIESDLIGGILDVVAALCRPRLVGYVAWLEGQGSTTAVRPWDASAADEIERVAGAVPDGESLRRLAQGFIVRIGPPGRPLGSIVVLEPQDPGRADEQLSVVTALGGVIAMAIAAARARRALTESEALYRLLVEDATDIAYTIDVDGRISWITPSVASVLGWSAEALVGRRLQDLVHPDDLAANRVKREQMLASGLTHGRAELRYATADGGWRWMAVAGRTVLDGDGRPVEGREALRDIDDLRRAAERLHEQQHRLQGTMESLLDPHVHLEAVRDEEGRIVDFVYIDANAAACAYNERTRDELVGARLLAILPGHAASGILADYAAVVDTGRPIIVDGLTYYNEILGQDRRSDVRGIRVGDGLSLTWRDVTERYEAADALADSEQRYRILAEHSTDVVAQVREGAWEWVSPSVSVTLGWLPDELVGRRTADLVHPDDRVRYALLQQDLDANRRVRDRIRMRASTGGYHWFEVSGGPNVDREGQPDGHVVSFRLVDTEVRALTSLESRAREDQLTGLANREEGLSRLTEVLGRMPRTGSHVAVVFCDVDNFKAVNDRLGHAAGDEMLRVLANRICGTVRSGDLVARIGGDELLVVLDGVHDLEGAARIAEKIRDVVAEPFAVDGVELRGTMSMGVSIAATGEMVDSLVARADAAMYTAKQTGRDRVVAVPAPLA